MDEIREVDVVLEEDAAKRYKIKLRFFSPLFFVAGIAILADLETGGSRQIQYMQS